VAESLDTKYHLEPATCHKLDIDSGRTKDLGARLTYELCNYVTTLIGTNESCNPTPFHKFSIGIEIKVIYL
jgi:hypothetical protein